MPKFRFPNFKKGSVIIFFLLSVVSLPFAGFHGSYYYAQAVGLRPSFLPAAGNEQRKNGKKFELTAPLKKCWSLNKILAAYPASDNDSEEEPGLFLYFADNEGDFKLEYADKSDAHRIWVVSLGGEMASGLLSDGKNLFMAIKNGDNYFLVNISKLTGVTNWRSVLSYSSFPPLPAPGGAPDNRFMRNEEFFLHFYKNTLIVAGRGGEVYSFEKMDGGRALWNTRLGKSLTAVPTFKENLAAFGFADGGIEIISLLNGAKLKELKASGSTVKASAVVFQTVGKIVLGDGRGGVSAFDSATGKKLWKVRVSGVEITGINRTEYGLLVSSTDNFAYLLSPANGKRVWKRRLAGRVVYQPLVLDAYAVVINSTAPRADVIELPTGRLVNQIALEEGNYFTGNILFDKNLLAFQTAQGLNAFSDAEGICVERAAVR